MRSFFPYLSISAFLPIFLNDPRWPASSPARGVQHFSDLRHPWIFDAAPHRQDRRDDTPDYGAARTALYGRFVGPFASMRCGVKISKGCRKIGKMLNATRRDSPAIGDH